MIKLVDYFVVVGYDSSENANKLALNYPFEDESDYLNHNNTNKHKLGLGRAKIIQRYPDSTNIQDNQNDEQEFDSNIHYFCQPHKGWNLYTKPEAPTFFVSVLTDIKGQRRYTACLTFLEPYQNNTLTEQQQHQLVIKPIEPSKLYSAKSLVLVSRLEYIDLFKSCLSLIYAVYVDKRHNSDNKQLEIIISNLLTIQVPSPGTALSTQFSLGADDKHIIQAPASLSVPCTGTSVYKLFKEIGIANVLKLVCGIMADFKILFFSRSYTKLYDACRALEALLFPLKYTGVYIPVLPCFGSFLESPAAPTPYIIGVHSSFRRLIEEMHSDCLQECIKVDLDGAGVNIPQCVDELISGRINTSQQPPQQQSPSSNANNNNNQTNQSHSSGLPHYIYESTLNLLYSILKPDVLHADELNEFTQVHSTNKHESICLPSEPGSPNSPTSQTKESKSNYSSQMSQSEVDSVWMDKLIRAVFVRMFSQLFAGYRYCLLIIRINPKPVICFNKASFLGHHELINNEFMTRLLDSMSFQRFIEERGPSYRNCDVFDDLYAAIQSHLIEELEQQDLDLNSTNSSYFSSNSSLIYQHVKQIAEKLFKYEYPHTNLQFSHSTSTNSSNNRNYLNCSNDTNNSANSAQGLKHFLSTQPTRSYSKIKLPTPDAYKRLHSETFPYLDSNEIQRLLNSHYSTQSSNSDLSSASSISCSITGINNNNSSSITQTAPRNHLCRPHLVPYGPPIETVHNLTLINKRLININEQIDLTKSLDTFSNSEQSKTCSMRKLETIEHFVQNIFENNFKEAKKNLNSANRALRDPRARQHLCVCLQKYVKKNQVILNNEQFEYVCKLLNEALANDSRLDEHGVAYAILPLSSAFYRKLNNNTIDQCIYTRLQQHDVWSNMLFWEMAFYTDVQRSIRPVYLSNEEFAAEQEKEQTTVILNQQNNTTTITTTATTENGLNLYSRPTEKTALEICGEQMEKYTLLNEEQRESFIRNEQGIIRSHVLHYITQMVNMKIPLDINTRIKQEKQTNLNLNLNLNIIQARDTSPVSTPSRSQSFDFNNESVNSSNTRFQNKRNSTVANKQTNEFDTVSNLNNSIASDDSAAYEQQQVINRNNDNFDTNEDEANYEQTFGECGYAAWKFISKFVENVCIEGNLSDSQRNMLHHNLAEVIRMQIEMLDVVFTQSKLVPLRTKPKLDQLKPEYMLNGEILIEPSPLRCYLVPDGREECLGVATFGHVLLPAEGALFLTNYRIIFRGIPVNDSLMSDSIITRSFPVSALTKEKKIGSSFRLSSEAQLSNGIQLRSCTFQLIKLYFDDEVTTEKIDKFRQLLLKFRYPQSIFEFFCFSNSSNKYLNPLQSQQQQQQLFNNLSQAQQNTLIQVTNKELGLNTIKTKSEKHSDAFRHFAKNTLRKAGLMPRSNRKVPAQIQTSQQASRTPETSRKLIRQNSSNTNSEMLENSFKNSLQIDSDVEADSLSVIEENFDQQANLAQYASDIEKLVESRLAYRDYLRQGLINFNLVHVNTNEECFSLNETDEQEFRICALNLNYQLAKSLPSLLIVPKQTTDECVRKNSKCHRQSRLPLIVWRHSKLKSIILRSSGFHGKGFLGMLIKTTNQQQQQQQSQQQIPNENNTTSMEQDKYLSEIIKLTRNTSNNFLLPPDHLSYCSFNSSNINNNNNNLNQNHPSLHSSALNANLSNNNPVNCMKANLCVNVADEYSITPITNRRSIFASKLEKAVQTIRNNYNLTNSQSNTSHHQSISNNYSFNNQNNNQYHCNMQQASVCASNAHYSYYSNNPNNKFNTIASISHLNQQQANLRQNKNLNLELINLDIQANQACDMLNDSFTTSSINSNYYFNNTQANTNNPTCQANKKPVNMPVPLYIICEKSQVKSLRLSTTDTSKESRYVFIPIDIHEVKDTKNSFKKLSRACVPSSSSIDLIQEHAIYQQQQQQQQNHSSSNQTSTNQKTSFGISKLTGSNKISRKKSSFNNNTNENPQLQHQTSQTNGFLKQINDSKWFDQIQLIINLANTIVDRVEEGSSVMVCLEEGWDLTSQVVSLAELLLDPFYRTLEGFSMLIEREWLSMGHRFTRRNNHTIDDQTGYAPVFVQFLDSVHQCLTQFPNAFEFNQFYLEFLAYHSASNRFRTFLLDNEYERVQHGLLTSSQIEQAQLNSSLHTNVSYTRANAIDPDTKCIWEYIIKVHFNSAKFFNFNYQPSVWRHAALRPSSEMYKLKLWRYFVKETLCTGPLYDLDLLLVGNLNQTTSNLINSNSSSSKTNEDLSLWYPVPVQSASDFYEQLNEILPSQYEILLKQIIRKYKLDELHQTTEQSLSQGPLIELSDPAILNDFLSKVFAESEPNDELGLTMPINWKNLWDYFYNLAEAKLLKEYLNDEEICIENHEYSSCALSMAKSFATNGKQNQNQTSNNNNNINGSGQILNKHLTLLSSYSSKSHSSGNSSTTYSSSSSATPPFPKPKLTVNNSQTKRQQLQKQLHEFEFFIFSSSNNCNLCNATFKSNTEFIGFKCRNCQLSCHEVCLNEYSLSKANILNECFGSNSNSNEFNDVWRSNGLVSVAIEESSSSNLVKFPLTNNSTNVTTTNTNSLAQLDTSSYSMNTNSTSSSSCSTTPNSNYSHSHINKTTKTRLQNQYSITNDEKMDTDIGSACVGLSNHLAKTNLIDAQYGVSETSNVESIANNQKIYKTNYEENEENSSYQVGNGHRNFNFINWSNSITNNHNTNSDHQTYAGYLKKQGALFKQWKERYFVLDSVKHQLRYYDSANDSLAKGVIDLSDVESINQGLSSAYMQQNQSDQISSKKVAFSNFISGGNFGGDANADSKSCFELKTSKRVYYFCAKSPQDATKWVKQLEMCCLDS